MPKNLSPPETSAVQNLNFENESLAIWMEPGYSRGKIWARMRNAAPNLKLFTPDAHQIPYSESLAYPSLHEGDSISTFNERIAEHGIDAIWPQDSAEYDLSGITAEVHSPATPATVALINDKAKFTEWLGENDPYRANAIEVIGVAAVEAEYDKRHSAGREVCIKPVTAVYGQGYWHLTDKLETSLLNNPEGRQIHPSIYLAALALEEAQYKPQRLLMMDWLPGPEVSIDQLCWRGVPLVHAARTKLDGGRQRIESEHPVVEHARSVANKLAMHGIINMQYRLDKDRNWKMLEINPRPAGGSIYSADAGFGIISNWAKLVARHVGPDDVYQHHDDIVIETLR